MADDEEEPTREDVLQSARRKKARSRTLPSCCCVSFSADYALSKDPAEKNRLLAEIQQVQRAQKAGVN